MGRPRLYNKEHDQRQIALVSFDNACRWQEERILASFFTPGKTTIDPIDLQRKRRYMRLGPARFAHEQMDQENRGRC